jgi:hypothetical protein
MPAMRFANRLLHPSVHVSARVAAPRAARAVLAFAAALLAPAVVLAQSLPTWRETTPTAALTGASIQGLAYGAGTFVLTASSNNPVADFFLTSPDGTAWTRQNLPAGGISGLRQVRYVNGKFWTAGGNGAGSSTVYNSPDGTTWSVVQTVAVGGLGTGGGLVDIAYGNGAYVAPLELGWLTSADGVTWTARSAPTPVGGSTLSAATGVAFANGVFVASFGSVSTVTSMFRSTDGLTWTPIPTLTAFGGYTRVFVFNNQFVVYERSNINPSLQGQGLASPDGVTWTRTGTTTNPYAGSGVTGVGNGYRVAISGVPALGNNRVAITTNNAAFTDIGISPLNRSIDRGFAVGATTIVGYTATSQVVVGDAPAAAPVAPVAPTISAAPVAQSASAGTSATFTVVAAGGGLTYQWLFNNTAISGATAASYTLPAVTAANAGSYSVRVTNTAGSVTSTGAVLTVTPAVPSTAYLGNLSIRSTAGAGAETLIVGVSIGGANTSGTKDLLIRAIGPTLTAFGVGGALADPKLDLYSGQTVLVANDNWDAAATPVAVQSAVGAFALAAGSRDAALVRNALAAGSYTVQITGVGGATGVALAELYDLASARTGATPRLVNISARTQVGTGGDILIVGFNVGGTGTRRLLIRAVGPTLAAFGVTGTLADPKLDVFSGTTVVAANDNWDAAVTPAALQTAVGAFALTANSRDAVVVANLAPGSYTAQVSGVNATTGVALVELYELP